jgi:hypothetical protein
MRPIRHAIALLLTGALGAAPAHAGGPPLVTATLLLYDRANVPSRRMTRAKATVARLYGSIGVGIEWHTPGPSVAGPDQDAGLVDLAVILIGPDAAGQRQRGDRILGRAPGTGSEPGRIAYVYHHRLERLTREIGQDPADILALVLAHEIGHLLLPLGAHSEHGVMRARWRTDELRRLDVGRLGFTAEQAGHILRRLDAD